LEKLRRQHGLRLREEGRRRHRAAARCTRARVWRPSRLAPTRRHQVWLDRTRTVWLSLPPACRGRWELGEDEWWHSGHV